MNKEYTTKNSTEEDLATDIAAKKTDSDKKGLLTTIAAISAMFLVVFGFGVMIGSNHLPASSFMLGATGVHGQEKGKDKDVDFESFWKAWSILENNFIDADEWANDEKLHGAIRGLAYSTGDPYTEFFPPREAKEFNEDLNGKFEGIGMRVDVKNSLITVVAPLKESPAENAGVMPGDIILKIDEESTEGMDIGDAVKLIRGEKGTTVVLTMWRESARSEVEIPVIRDVITVPAIEHELRPDGVFVIEILQFDDTVSEQFDIAVKKFVASNSKKLIIDVRSNPGGYLDEANKIISRFLTPDSVIVRSQGRTENDQEVYRSKRGYQVIGDDVEIVVLIDGGSASASEILAAALSEHDKATLIGTPTFGKGSVQEIIPVTNDTYLKVTIREWLTPDGNSISEDGLSPDIEVPYTAEDREADRDPQLDEAVKFLQQPASSARIDGV